MGETAPGEGTGAEIERLTAELAEAHTRLDAALKAEPKGDIAKDSRLHGYLVEAKNVLDIVRRIQKIGGTDDSADSLKREC